MGLMETDYVFNFGFLGFLRCKDFEVDRRHRETGCGLALFQVLYSYWNSIYIKLIFKEGYQDKYFFLKKGFLSS